MFLVHQIAGAILNPCGIALGLMVLALVLIICGGRKAGVAVLILDILVTAAMSLPVTSEALARCLEEDYPPMRAEECPAADAIIVLGGGMAGIPAESKFPYPDMSEAADRVWHGARIYHALGGNVPIYCTAGDVASSTRPILLDLGVKEEDIRVVESARNTEEEARELAAILKGRKAILVTSALHMKRASMIFSRFADGVEIVPSATDHLAWDVPRKSDPWKNYVPDADAFRKFGYGLHEVLGLLRYTLF